MNRDSHQIIRIYCIIQEYQEQAEVFSRLQDYVEPLLRQLQSQARFSSKCLLLRISIDTLRPGMRHMCKRVPLIDNLFRETLKPATSLVLLEDILERHQSRLVHLKASESEVKALLALGQFYVEGLIKARRPIAATQFLRNFAAAMRARANTRERYAEARVAMLLDALYRALRDFGGEQQERWKVICEANEILEKLTPDDWEPDAPRSLRIQRAQIQQYYNAEEDISSSDPSTRHLVLDRLISNHEKVLQLESGIKSQRSDETRLKSLRAICSLKEEKGRGEDYRVYAQEYHTLMRNKFRQAVDSEFDISVAHDYLTGYVILCQAQVRAKKWDQALKTASEGIEKAIEVDWPEGFGSQVERCQLYVHRSRCHLKLMMPKEALLDARDAVAMAESIPWNDTHPDPVVAREYPTAYRKQHWRYFSLSNFADTAYDGQVQAPEEKYGLIAADKGLSLTKERTQDPDQEYYEQEFGSKKIRALRKLKQWNDALAACSDLSKKLTQQLSTSKRVEDLAQSLVDVYEDAASCLEAMGRKDLGNQLFDQADALADFTEKSMPLQSYVAKANDLQIMFDPIYKSIASPNVPLLGYLCKCYLQN